MIAPLRSTKSAEQFVWALIRRQSRPEGSFFERPAASIFHCRCCR
jgi:hypothetical protein